jgi:hypothetical protein
MFSGIDFNEDTVGMAHIKTMCSGASSSGVNMVSYDQHQVFQQRLNFCTLVFI